MKYEMLAVLIIVAFFILALIFGPRENHNSEGYKTTKSEGYIPTGNEFSGMGYGSSF